MPLLTFLLLNRNFSAILKWSDDLKIQDPSHPEGLSILHEEMKSPSCASMHTPSCTSVPVLQGALLHFNDYIISM